MRKSAQNTPTAQNSPQRPRMTQNARKFLPNLPKTFQNLPKILPKSIKIEPKSKPDSSKSTFEDHSTYKHEKKSFQNDPKSPKSLQTLPKTSPKPSQMEPETSPNQIFEGFFGLVFSYREFASIFCCFFAKFACFFKSRPSNFMRPRSVSWPSTPFNAFRKNHQKSSKNLPKILPKPFPKPRKINPKSQKIVTKTQDNLRCVKNSKK